MRGWFKSCLKVTNGYEVKLDGYRCLAGEYLTEVVL